MSKVSEVGELVTPLRDNSHSVFEEGDHDQESPDGREVSVNVRPVRSCVPSEQGRLQDQVQLPAWLYSRFQGLSHGIQPVFDLACLFSDLVQRTGITRGIGTSLRAELVVQAQVIACGSSYLRHGGKGCVVRKIKDELSVGGGGGGSTGVNGVMVPREGKESN